LKSYVMTVLAEIDRRISEKQQIDAFNAAVRLANSRKIAEALTSIEKLIPTISDASLLDRAKELRQKLIKAKSKE